MRWGYGTDVKLLSTDDGMLVVTMVGPSPGQVRYATFNHDGSKVAAATDDCRVGAGRAVGQAWDGKELGRGCGCGVRVLLGKGRGACGGVVRRLALGPLVASKGEAESLLRYSVDPWRCL